MRLLGFTIVFFTQGDNRHTPLSCLVSRTRFFLVFTHVASWEPCSVTHDFPVKVHSHFSTVCMFSLSICGLCIHFSPAQLRTWLSSSIFGLFNFPRWLHCWERALVFQRWLDVSTFVFWGCCRLFWSHFGHDRAKNGSGIVFPYPSCESLVQLHVCSGWSSDCVGVGMRAWFAC